MTAKQLITDALELRHRLPETWKRVAALEVPAWKGRHVAVLTHTLSLEAAAWVDQQIAPRLKRCGAKAVDTVVAHAIAKYDPARHAEREARAKKQPGTSPAHPGRVGVRRHQRAPHHRRHPHPHRPLPRLSRDAVAAGKAGDDQPLGVRKVKALATLFTGAQAATHAGGRAGERSSGPPPQTVLYLHLDKADLDDDGLVKIGRAERLGPVTTDKIREWLGSIDVRIQPVIRMDGDDAVNGHDPPDRIRDQVILRDPTCRFPGCQVDTEAATSTTSSPTTPTGPPGQTRPSNLVPLCRRHHNAKTTGLWRYTRTPFGDCVWTGPYTAGAYS